MLKNISIGVYYPGNSLLHRLQARTKLLVLLWIVIWLTIANQRIWHFVPFAVVVVLMSIGIALSHISLYELWRRTWLLLLLIVLGAVPTLFTLSDKLDKPIYTFGPWYVSYGVAYQIGVVALIVLGVPLLSSFLPGIRRVWQHAWLRRSRALLFLLVLVLVASLWFVQTFPATNTFPLGPLVITRSGLWFQASFFAMLLVLYIFSLLLTMTTSPVALIEGLTMLLAPLRRLRLPVDDFALMALVALRFIPTLLEETEQLMKAQSARGADMARGALRERVQSLTLLFVPLMNAVLRRAAELGTALEARGYEVEGKQTRLYESSFAFADYLVMGVVVLVTLVSLVF